MKFVPARSRKRVLGAAAASLAVLLGTTGCQAINEQATTKTYSPSDGVIADVGDTALRNIAFVTEDKDSEARVIGTISNRSDNDVSVTLSIPSGQVQATVPANDVKNLEEANLTVPSVTDIPGSLIPVNIRINGETEELQVPVLSPALEEYADLVETESNPTRHLNHQQRYPDMPEN